MLEPIAQNGYVYIGKFDGMEPGKTRKVGITQLQLEQDTAKSVTEGENWSLLDYNRAGVGILEIVFKPELRSSSEAAKFIKKVQLILRCAEISDASMDEGSLRVDVNVSLKKKEGKELGVKCELKNLISTKNIQEAIDAEIIRQEELLNRGEHIVSTSRSFDAISKKTVEMRSKDSSLDYRYFPDPELPCIIVDQKRISEVKARLPELPDEQALRLSRLGLNKYQVSVLMENLGAVKFLDCVLEQGRDSKDKRKRNIHNCANFLLNTLSGELSRANLSFMKLNESNYSCGISPKLVANIVDHIQSENLFLHQTSTIIRDILKLEIKDKSSIDAILRQNLSISPNDESKDSSKTSESIINLTDVVYKVIKDNPSALKDLKKGKSKALTFLMGQSMRLMKGKCDPKTLKTAVAKSILNKGIDKDIVNKWLNS